METNSDKCPKCGTQCKTPYLIQKADELIAQLCMSKGEDVGNICHNCGRTYYGSQVRCPHCAEIAVKKVVEDEIDKQKFYIETMDGNERYEIMEHDSMVGKECLFAEYLRENNFVSRKHMKIKLENGVVVINNESESNSLFVSSLEKEIPQKTHEYIEIPCGTIIALGATATTMKNFPKYNNKEVGYLKVVKSSVCC